MYTREEVLELVNGERNLQDEKWGEKNHKPERWATIIGEEYGEYCEAANKLYEPDGNNIYQYDHMISELTDLAATAVAAIECLLRHRLEHVGWIGE